MGTFIKINNRIINVDKIVQIVKTTNGSSSKTEVILVNFGTGFEQINDDDAQALYKYMTSICTYACTSPC